MFDISFAELMMIAIVGLLVIGPEKLPKVARTLGAYTGRLQRYVSQVKAEVNREVRFEELQSLQQEIKAGVGQVQSSIRDSEKSMNDALVELEKDVKPKRKPAARKAKTATKKPVAKKPVAEKTLPRKALVKKKTVKKSSVKSTKNKG